MSAACLYDFNGNGTVDAFDIREVTLRFNARVGSTNYLLELDLAGDGFIDALDVRAALNQYGAACAPA